MTAVEIMTFQFVPLLIPVQLAGNIWLYQHHAFKKVSRGDELQDAGLPGYDSQH